MITDVLKWLFKLNIIVAGKLRDSEDILLTTLMVSKIQGFNNGYIGLKS